MALSDDNKLAVGKSHARNGEWVNIIMKKVNILLSMDDDADWQSYLNYLNVDLKFVEEQRQNLFSKFNKLIFELNKCRDELLVLKQAKLEAVTLQIQNTELVKQNQALQDELKKEKAVIYKWTQKNPRVFDSVSLTPSNKKAIVGEDQNTESSSENHGEKAFLPSGISFNKERETKPSDWIEIVNPDSKLPNFNTGKILEPESQAIKNMLGVTDESSSPESINESEHVSKNPLPSLKVLQGAETSSELTPLVYTQHSPREKAALGRIILKRPLTEVSVPNDDSTTSVSNEAITDIPDSKYDQLAELVRKLSEKIESSEKNPQPLKKEIKPASSSSTKSKATSKPKLRCELCNYTAHTTHQVLYPITMLSLLTMPQALNR
jgi:hypothetical protein